MPRQSPRQSPLRPATTPRRPGIPAVALTAEQHASALAATAHPVPRSLNAPVFAQPEPTPDPTKFKVPHPSDSDAYKEIDKLNSEHKLRPLPFPAPRGGTEPCLTLSDILGGGASARTVTRRIESAGQLVFHCVGDTGNTRGPDSQNRVADAMTADYADTDAADIPSFFLHLGDVIYNFGEAKYYYDQFYDPYRDYPAPIVALAGNHDGMVAPGSGAVTLAAFLDNFCAGDFTVSVDAGGLSRTAQIQPGVFFTFEAPLLRVIALYTNTLEDPGVISSEDGTWPEIGDSQLDFLEAALTRAKAESKPGALILAYHHPSYTSGSKHGWSPKVTAQIDAVCGKVGLWPHAVLSAHAHNYQRFTRLHGGTHIPYIVAGNGGHGIARLGHPKGQTLRVPRPIQAAGDGIDAVTFENYDDANYGYLRIVVTESQLRIEYHAVDGTGTTAPRDSVTVDLASRQTARFVPRLEAATSVAAPRRSGAQRKAT